MPYCKNCGAYIPSDDTKCDECGTVNGKTPLMRLQKAIKTNGNIDDIIEKPEIDNSPIAMPKERSKPIEKEKITEQSKESENENTVIKEKDDYNKSKFSDYLVDVPMPSKEEEKHENVSSESKTNLVEPLSDLDDDFDMFSALGLEKEEDKTDFSVKESNNEKPVETTETSDKIHNGTENTDALDDLDDEQLNDFINKYTAEKTILSDEDISDIHLYNNYNNESESQPENPISLDCEEKAVFEEKKGSHSTISQSQATLNENEQSEPVISPASSSIEASSNVSETESADISKKKSKGKLPIILIAVFAVIIAGYITLTQTGVVNNLFNKDVTTTTLAGAVTTTNSQETTVQVNDAYTYAEVYQATGVQAAQAIEGIVNGYNCGAITSVSIDAGGKVTLKTDDWEILFRLRSTTVTEDAFNGKSVMVVGSALYNSISAEKVYIYNSTDIIEVTTTETTTMPEQTVPDPITTEAPTEVITDAPTDAPTTKRVTTTKAKTTETATTVTPTVSIEYISASRANQLMASWRADGTKLGESNAYYGTIKSVSASGDTVTIKTAKFTIIFKSNESINASSLVGKNVLAVAKPESNGTVRASQIYIY